MGKYLIIHGRIDVFIAGYVRLADVWGGMKIRFPPIHWLIIFPLFCMNWP
jgi:hypothetical protein